MPDTTILQHSFGECMHASATCAGAEPGNAALRLLADTSSYPCCHGASDAAGNVSEPTEAIHSTATTVRHGWWVVPDVPQVTAFGKRLDWRRQPAHRVRRRTPASMPC